MFSVTSRTEELVKVNHTVTSTEAQGLFPFA